VTPPRTTVGSGTISPLGSAELHLQVTVFGRKPARPNDMRCLLRRVPDRMILWSTENLFFVSKWSQARITVTQLTTVAALSLLALPTAGDAVRVDAGYARGREYSGLRLGRKRCLVLARARSGPTATPWDGREAQAGAETHEGEGTLEGVEPFFGRVRCGASCLAPDWDEEEV
jgi:hypothetical protein